MFLITFSASNAKQNLKSKLIGNTFQKFNGYALLLWIKYKCWH